ncbi:hypothetical protein Vafri_9147 [Volvox africanus]|uniref:Uncharacterized protein n=1 Tax=Volvox africanus TaxID=51714 RepID=A0A8J4EYT2_9CHLO|nr:hypothetical protein Vafri_9147 [Volvox africanus]
MLGITPGPRCGKTRPAAAAVAALLAAVSCSAVAVDSQGALDWVLTSAPMTILAPDAITSSPYSSTSLPTSTSTLGSPPLSTPAPPLPLASSALPFSPLHITPLAIGSDFPLLLLPLLALLARLPVLDPARVRASRAPSAAATEAPPLPSPARPPALAPRPASFDNLRRLGLRNHELDPR